MNVDRKHITKLGLAVIGRALCLPWARKAQRIVCQEHCSVADKAIKLEKENIFNTMLLKPYVDQNLCVGCGICQNKCPVRPLRAIRVFP